MWPTPYGPHDGSYSVNEVLELPLRSAWSRTIKTERLPLDPLQGIVGAGKFLFYRESKFVLVGITTSGDEVMRLTAPMNIIQLETIGGYLIVNCGIFTDHNPVSFIRIESKLPKAWSEVIPVRLVQHYDESIVSGFGVGESIFNIMMRVPGLSAGSAFAKAYNVQIPGSQIIGDGTCFAVTAANQATHTESTAVVCDTTNWQVLSFPELLKGSVFWISGNSLLYRYQRENDPCSYHRLIQIDHGVLKTIYDLPWPIDLSGYCVAGGHTLIACVPRNKPGVRAFDIATGSEKWSIDVYEGSWFDNAVEGSSCWRSFNDYGYNQRRFITDGRHAFCALEHCIREGGKDVKTYHLVAINVETGNKDWISEPIKVPKSLKVFQVLAVVDDTLLLLINDKLQGWKPAK